MREVRPVLHARTLPLHDRFGRRARDLRVSVTDRCNLRCTYCMPAEGLPWLPKEEPLTADEIHRLVTLAVNHLGIERIRITGGEPLLRHDLADIIQRIAQLRRPDGTPLDIGLTTNGLGLDKHALPLARAGLCRVNVSLDSVTEKGYGQITRRPRLKGVLAGIEAAERAGLRPIKINAVALPNNLHEIPELLKRALNAHWELRIIEHMPLGPHGVWDIQGTTSATQVLNVLANAGFVLQERQRADGRPAQIWEVLAGDEYPGGTVGIIASMTRPFCHDCDRTRLTADGQMMSCLFSSQSVDLRGPMRRGASDAELLDLWRKGMWNKPLAHGRNDGVVGRPERTMSSIGG